MSRFQHPFCTLCGKGGLNRIDVNFPSLNSHHPIRCFLLSRLHGFQINKIWKWTYWSSSCLNERRRFKSHLIPRSTKPNPIRPKLPFPFKQMHNSSIKEDKTSSRIKQVGSLKTKRNKGSSTTVIIINFNYLFNNSSKFPFPCFPALSSSFFKSSPFFIFITSFPHQPHIHIYALSSIYLHSLHF